MMFEVGKKYRFSNREEPLECLFVGSTGGAVLHIRSTGEEYFSRNPEYYEEYKEPRKLTIYIKQRTDGELFPSDYAAMCAGHTLIDTIEWVEKV